MTRGHVALVGAGPGDPALLTLRAAELLRAADVVAHDQLVSESILAMVPATALLLPVGRRAGGGDTPYRLHPEVLAHARAGRLVVRLKAGDPLVFGRGGEEAQELAAAGISFEIVPGISAALGAASYESIPLTHRDHASQVVLSTGHRGDGGLPPPGPGTGRTLVLYMAARELPNNLNELRAAGWPAETPAALVVSATTAQERAVTGTLETLAERVAAARTLDDGLPALVIVGGVVGLRDETAWRERLPLRGRQVIVARARIAPSRVAAALRGLGAVVLELPHIESAATKAHAGRLVPSSPLGAGYDAIVVASADAAEAFSNARTYAAGDPPVLAIGHEVAASLRAGGMAVAAVASGACADAMAAIAPWVRGRRVLVLVAGPGRPGLRAELERVGASVEEVAVASAGAVAPARWPSHPDLVVLPASSAARALYSLAPAHLRDVAAVAIGDQTAAAARSFGVQSVRMASGDDIDLLVRAAVEALPPPRADIAEPALGPGPALAPLPPDMTVTP